MSRTCSPAALVPALASLFAAGCGGPTVPAAPGAGVRGTPKVLVIGIDGVRPDVLAEVPTPNLDALAADGFYSDQARTARPTVSGPAWSSFLTGVWPDKHGVTNNQFTGKRYHDYPDFLTRIEDARPELSTFAAADWAPLLSASDGGPVVTDRVDRKVELDGYETGWAEGDSAVTAAAVAHLRDGRADAVFVYLGNPDETSHRRESIGREYREAIALADRHVGWLIAAVRSRPSYNGEDWLVLVSTDHGRRADGGHGGNTPQESTIFYLASGPSASRDRSLDDTGELPAIVDIPVTALAHLGIAIDPNWRLDGRVVGIGRGVAEAASPWSLVWADEFEGPAGQLPDPAKWTYDIGTDWGNQQLEFDTDRAENVSLDGSGNLAITAREEAYQGSAYTSARITTEDRFEPTYGRFEARIKLPAGQGIWPAFWLLGADIDTTGWPETGEIDIMEYRGQEPSIVLGTLHGPGYSASVGLTQNFMLQAGRFDADFHVFAVEWGRDGIRWFVDDQLYHVLTPEDVPGRWVFDHPFYLILNVAVGGGFVGPPDETTTFPQSMLIDWVRVYERTR